MRRREFITLLGGLATWSRVARAQQATVPLVGYFSGRSSGSEAPLLASFGKGLAEGGFTIGKNVAVEYRFSDGDEDRLPAIAADFVRRRVNSPCCQRHALGTSRQGGDFDHSNRLRRRPRPGCARLD
jgi:putative ABC transport system substrate-binding protein